VAERKNRTIFDMAQNILKSKKLPKVFWAEVVACAVYLSNRSPTRSVWEKTPQEAWSGRKPGISHLRVLGSVAHVHIPDEKRVKLDDKSEKFIFVGYDQSSKCYKLYNPYNNKIVISRDVVFDEEGEWDFGAHKKEYSLFPEFEEETSREVHHPLMKIQVVKELRRVHKVFKISMTTQKLYHHEGLKISIRKQEKQI